MIYGLVVVYNKKCEDSHTCMSLLKQKNPDFSVLIFDNSEPYFGNRDFCRRNGWQYLGGCGNQGLSKAYNQAVAAVCPAAAREDYLCLFDDDTELPENYVAGLLNRIGQVSKVEILVPILTQDGAILSPWKMEHWGRAQFFASAEECLRADPDSLYAFNSCMLIRLDVFENYRYDERLFLDGIDYAFLRDMHAAGRMIEVWDCVCQHAFSGRKKTSFESALGRFRIYAKDFAVLNEKQKRTYIYIIGKRALHLCLQHRSMRFLWIFIRNL